MPYVETKMATRSELVSTVLMYLEYGNIQGRDRLLCRKV